MTLLMKIAGKTANNDELDWEALAPYFPARKRAQHTVKELLQDPSAWQVVDVDKASSSSPSPAKAPFLINPSHGGESASSCSSSSSSKYMW